MCSVVCCKSVQAPEGAGPLLCTALKCCLAADKGTRHGPVLGSFLADTLSPLPAITPLLQVWSVYCTACVRPWSRMWRILSVRISSGMHSDSPSVASTQTAHQ